ncbi:MAG TPA: DUF5663 domain-containing protein [Candidatus Saccharimonadales bacterium]|jgi:hypothetical protein|nr:DUF5663 domain-containing protein [Candidatus Saccharimonadales bacterium]
MFQLDDNFLQTVGLGAMPADQKQAFLQHIYEELELRVGTKLSEGLSDDQLTEFESFMNGDEGKIRGWLAANLEGYEQSEEYQKFTQNIPPETKPLAVLAEFASLKWLEVNRPNYKDVVAAELEKLKTEISANSAQILGNQAAA